MTFSTTFKRSGLTAVLAAVLLSLAACKPEAEQQASKQTETSKQEQADKSDKSAKTAAEKTAAKDAGADARKADAAKRAQAAKAARAKGVDAKGRPLPGGTRRLESTEAKALLAKKPDTVVLDLRDPDDYKKEHLDRALNLDQSEEKTFAQKVKTLDKSKTYLLYDYRTRRSEKAYAELQKAGFKQVYLLEGGIREWTKAGLPVKK